MLYNILQNLKYNQKRGACNIRVLVIDLYSKLINCIIQGGIKWEID